MATDASFNCLVASVTCEIGVANNTCNFLEKIAKLDVPNGTYSVRVVAGTLIGDGDFSLVHTHTVGPPGSASCVLCAAGTYSATSGATTSSTCSSCPPRSSSLSGSNSLNDCICNSGSSGPDGGECTQCVAGKHKTSTGNAPCLLCDVGEYTLAGSDTCLPCSAPLGQFCPPGSTSSTGSECPAGSYCTGGTANQEACPDRSNSLARSTVLTACTCNAGWSGPNGGSCTSCTAGTYKSSTGSASCALCAGDTYSDIEGAATSSTCSSCPLQSSSPSGSHALSECTCNSGYHRKNATQCNACPKGSYCENEDSTVPCPANYESPELSDQIGNCTCPQKYYWKSDSEGCILCPADSYCTTEGQGTQVLCPTYSGTRTFEGQTEVEACVCFDGYAPPLGSPHGDCVPCTGGIYCASDLNVSCPLHSDTSHVAEGTLLSSRTQCHCHQFYRKTGNFTTTSICEKCNSSMICLGGANDKQGTLCGVGAKNNITDDVYKQKCMCGVGEYCNSDDSANPLSCNEPDTCDVCPVKSWCVNNNKHDCPDHSASQMTGLTDPSQCQCDPGYHEIITDESRHCEVCPENFYCYENHKYDCRVLDSYLTTFGTHHFNVQGCICNEGYFRVSDSDK